MIAGNFLEPPTVYRTTTAGRVVYAALAAAALAFAVTLLFILAFRPARPATWIEWVFVIAVAVPALVFAFYSGARAIQSSERLHVTAEGFTYRGVLREHHVYWISVVTASWGVWDPTHLILGLSSPKLSTLRLDLTSLSPSASEFMRQVWRFAPAKVAEPWLAKQIRKLAPQPKPRYAAPEEIPDFDKMRGEVEEVTTGKDREDLLRNLDKLEQGWKSRLDPSLRSPGK